jgi:type VI secretion system secreted protein Hcp
MMATGSKCWIRTFAVLGLLLGAGPLQASIFLEIDGIDGDVTTPNYENQIKVDTLTGGFSVPYTFGSGGGIGPDPAYSELVVTKASDPASPLLMQRLLTRSVLPTVIVHATQVGGETREEYLTITLTNAFVSALAFGGTVSEKPTESVHFGYEQICYRYTDFPDGGGSAETEFCWDAVNNQVPAN